MITDTDMSEAAGDDIAKAETAGDGSCKAEFGDCEVV